MGMRLYFVWRKAPCHGKAFLHQVSWDFSNQTLLTTRAWMLYNRPDLQTFTYYIKNKSKSCESQARSTSQHFTGKSEQNITSNLSC